MSRNFHVRSHFWKVLLKILEKAAGRRNAEWIRALEEEASCLHNGQHRWIVAGLLGLLTHRANRFVPELLRFCALPLAAIILFSLLARSQFLIWNSDNPLVGPAILLMSVTPFAWYLGRQVRSHTTLWATLAFAFFQTAPAILWPMIYGETLGLKWGVNVDAFGLPQWTAPFVAWAVWFVSTIGARRVKYLFRQPMR